MFGRRAKKKAIKKARQANRAQPVPGLVGSHFENQRQLRKAGMGGLSDKEMLRRLNNGPLKNKDGSLKQLSEKEMIRRLNTP